MLRCPSTCCSTGCALLITDGHAAAAPNLQRAVARAHQHSRSRTSCGGAGWPRSPAAWCGTSRAFTRSRRDMSSSCASAGAVAQLPLHLWQLALCSTWIGDLPGAASLAAESESVAAATGSRFAPYTLLRLRALQGSEAELSASWRARPSSPPPRDRGCRRAGTGRTPSCGTDLDATRRQRWRPRKPPRTPSPGGRRCGRCPSSSRRLCAAETPSWPAMPSIGSPQRHNRATPTSLAASKHAAGRCSATVRRPTTCIAKRSIGSSRTRLLPDIARAHLLYGEWLRREGRRVDAREQLRRAHDMLAAIGMEAFAERARRELIATGEKVRKRSDESRDQLTPQEEQIARLARDGSVEPGDRRATVHQCPHRRVAPEPCLHEARHQLSPAASGRAPQGQSRPHRRLAGVPRR